MSRSILKSILCAFALTIIALLPSFAMAQTSPAEIALTRATELVAAATSPSVDNYVERAQELLESASAERTAEAFAFAELAFAESYREYAFGNGCIEQPLLSVNHYSTIDRDPCEYDRPEGKGSVYNYIRENGREGLDLAMSLLIAQMMQDNPTLTIEEAISNMRLQVRTSVYRITTTMEEINFDRLDEVRTRAERNRWRSRIETETSAVSVLFERVFQNATTDVAVFVSQGERQSDEIVRLETELEEAHAEIAERDEALTAKNRRISNLEEEIAEQQETAEENEPRAQTAETHIPNWWIALMLLCAALMFIALLQFAKMQNELEGTKTALSIAEQKNRTHKNPAIAGLQEKLDNAIGRVYTLGGMLDEAYSWLAVMNDRVNELSHERDNAISWLNMANLRIVRNEGELAKIMLRVPKLRELIEQLEAKLEQKRSNEIDALLDKYLQDVPNDAFNSGDPEIAGSALHGWVNGISRLYDNLEDEVVTNLQEKLVAAQAELETLRTDAAQLRQDLAKAQAEAEGNATIAFEAQEQLAELRKAFQDQVEETARQMVPPRTTELQERIANLSTRLQTAEQELGDSRRALGEKLQRIRELHAERDGLKETITKIKAMEGMDTEGVFEHAVMLEDRLERVSRELSRYESAANTSPTSSETGLEDDDGIDIDVVDPEVVSSRVPNLAGQLAHADTQAMASIGSTQPLPKPETTGAWHSTAHGGSRDPGAGE